MAFALSAYNGGLGWVQRDRRTARAAGADPDRWWAAVERYNAGRNAASFAENRGYPKRILTRNEPLYIGAGWGLGVCT
jgi:membrane-bound lytic murein transglycosylase MltF